MNFSKPDISRYAVCLLLTVHPSTTNRPQPLLYLGFHTRSQRQGLSRLCLCCKRGTRDLIRIYNGEELVLQTTAGN